MARRIGYLIGSLSSTSINRRLAKSLIGLAPASLEFFEIGIRDLPLFTPDLEQDLPPTVSAFKRELESADGILFVSPEYNRSIPGALKNAIDWGSRPRGRNSFARKPSAIIGASTGAIGTALMQASMRNVLSFLDAPQLTSPEAYITFRPEAYADDGTVRDDATRRFLEHWVGEYAGFVDRVLAVNAPGQSG
ncbi:MAG: NAD(P)H-dependent oxidoreductase [Actinobacteria bacterium]|nr:NAD(P)H-dependent oxidoreductase [Actinomycetota bacterium]